MRIDLETEFVNNFISKEYRHRIEFELKSHKKRLNALMKFAHMSKKIIREDRLCLELDKFDEDRCLKFLCDEQVYVISYKYFNGVTMNTKLAIQYISIELLPVIICAKNCAIIKQEYEGGKNSFIFLKNI